MRRRVLLLIVGSALAAIFATAVPTSNATRWSEALPSRLTDAQFWKVIADFSEPNGHFRSDNLLSNELFLQSVIPELARTVKPQGAYLGVGPEQNFTYISALRPRIAFIVDVRRGNLHLHLMYKALFELSEDRAEFVSRLFSKARPAGLGPASTVQQLFAAFAGVETSDTAFQSNLRDIRNHLVRTHALDLDEEDLKGIEYVYDRFFWHGPAIQYWSTSQGRGASNAPTYVELMVADDGTGKTRSYLATEESFRFLKQLHANNLLVPVVGNFAGPKALRSVARYLREHGAVVSAFYLSNVEQYLDREGLRTTFCGNAALLPFDASSAFIRSVRTGTYGFGVGLDSQLGNIASDLRTCTQR
jgi:hypothetical protein